MYFKFTILHKIHIISYFGSGLISVFGSATFIKILMFGKWTRHLKTAHLEKFPKIENKNINRMEIMYPVWKYVTISNCFSYM